MPPVRLFVGNLPYQATEDDLRTHFAQVGQPTQIVRPLDRETGRARGFAFVEYAERSAAEAAIKQFDGQLFMGRPLAVSEARAREDRGPGGPPRSGESERAPIVRPPFHALGPAKAYVVFTNGGLRVNARTEVLRKDGSVIAGLFAAGSTGQGGMLLEGHGHHLGWAFVSGRIAGRNAALLPDV